MSQSVHTICSVSSIIYIVSFGIVCKFAVEIRDCLGTSIVVVGTICIISHLVFLLFELTALILMVTSFFTMVAGWFVLVGLLLWGLLRHSVYGHFVWSFQTIQFQLPFKMRHNLFIRAVLQVGLVYWFLQVWRHFGIYELVNDCLGSNSERIFCQFLEFVKKSNNFWFTGLKTSCWKLCFAVAIDWGFFYFLRNTVRISPIFSLLGRVMFLKVCRASPRKREWK